MGTGGAARPTVRPSARATARPGAVLGLGMVAFAGIGLSEATLGVAFPKVRETFDLPLDRLGVLLLPATVGYLLVAAAQARARRPWPVAPSLIGAAGLAAAGSATYALSPAFGVMLAGSFLLGLSTAGVDTTLNNYVPRHLEPRLLAFMHGGFGVGAVAGPFAATAVLGAGWSWRWAYAGFGALQVALALGWLLARHRLAAPAAVPAPAEVVPAEVVSFEGDVATLPAVVTAGGPRFGVILPLNVVLFFLYTGIEASTGLLLPTLLVHRGVSEATAGLLTVAFWTALTLGRFATGFLGRRLTPSRALGAAAIGCVVGMIGVAAGTGVVTGLAGVVVGFALAPVFPSLVAITPARVGSDRTHVAIACQLAAASIGVAAVPAIIGLIAGRAGPGAIGPSLFTVAALLAGVHVLAGLVAGDLGHGPGDAAGRA